MQPQPRYLYDYPNKDSSFPFYIGRTCCASATVHRHDFLELSLVVEGQGIEILNGEKHEMKKGTMIFYFPYQFHQIEAAHLARLQIVNCNFDLSLLQDIRENSRDIHSLLMEKSEAVPSHIQLTGDEFDRMYGIFTDMLEEYAARAPWSSLMIRLKLCQALVLFDRRRDTGRTEAGYPAAAAGHPPVWQMIQYVHNRYAENITLGDLERHFHFGKTHISNIFKKYAGLNFIDFLHEVRIRNACSLLASTDKSITEVAMEIGFGSFATFSRIFRKIKCVSPSQYRREKNASYDPLRPKQRML